MTRAEWRDTLVVQIAGLEGHPPSILELQRPEGGRVRVREWADGAWTLPARESEPSCEELLARFNASLADVVRVRYILPNAAEFSECWPVLRKHFGEIRPAATMISAGLSDPRMRIEIEVTARKRTGA